MTFAGLFIKGFRCFHPKLYSAPIYVSLVDRIEIKNVSESEIDPHPIHNDVASIYYAKSKKLVLQSHRQIEVYWDAPLN